VRRGTVVSSSSTRLPSPEGPGSVSGAPNLPAGFTGTFTSRYVDTGELRLHAVTGGDGPPLLLVHGWPQTWYAWRLLMPALARDFQVIAVDQRGIGLSDKPQGGYDTGTLASDLVALMDALGHQRFALWGTDVGVPIAYALAADHRDRLDRLVVSEAPLPGISPSPPLFLPPQLNERLWHLAFNQLPKVNEQPSPDGKTSSSARSSMPRPGRASCPTTRSGTTSTPSPPTPKPFAAASGSTVRSPPASRRTSSARPSG
jgi:pimeloyl-ACP methyl ester carboxylesterase